MSADSSPSAPAPNSRTLTPNALFRLESLRATDETPYIDYSSSATRRLNPAAVLVCSLLVLGLGVAALYVQISVSVPVSGHIATYVDGAVFSFVVPDRAAGRLRVGSPIHVADRRATISRIKHSRADRMSVPVAFVRLAHAPEGAEDGRILLGKRRIASLLSRRNARR